MYNSGIKLTDRDLEILLGLARNGFFTISQIQKKWFNVYGTCANRLAKLKKYGYVDSFHLWHRSGGIFHLQKNGLNYVNDHFDANYKLYYKSNKINHYLACSDFYLAFPYEIVDYILELDLKSLRPDIYLKYNNGKFVDMFVEIDRTGLKKILYKKVILYNKYFESMVWKEKFDKFPKILFITTNKKLVNTLESDIPILFTTFDNFDNLDLLLK